MRLLRPLAIALALLALSGCAQLETRDEDAPASDAQAAQTSENLYRLDTPVVSASPEPREDNTPDYGLWTRVARDFTMHDNAHERIERELFFYQGRIDQLERITRRAEPYLFFIVEQLRERGMPMELALLPIVESAYQPQATSRSQAAGLWQFIPSTGTHFGLKQNWWYDGRRDVHASTNAALDYLQYLNRFFNGDWHLALAAYNAGEGTVSRAIERAAAKGQPTDYWSLDLPEETKAYVPRLLALARLFREPQAYGLTPHKVDDSPFLARIEIDRSLDLSKLANAVDMSVDDLYRFNPGFKRGVNGNGKEAVALMLPYDKAELLRAMNVDAFCVSMERPRQVVAKKQESLDNFANRYRIDVATLRDFNPGLGKSIKRGQKLMLPPADAVAEPRQPDPITLAANTPRNTDTGPYSITHAVAPGDNLFSISRKHGVDVTRLASWNGLKTDARLKPGQKLTVYTDARPTAKAARDNPSGKPPAVAASDPPTVKDKDKALAAAKPSSPPGPTQPSKVTYTVQKGDTLYGIAKRFKVEVSQIRAWNNMKDKDDIKPGQSIVVAQGASGAGVKPG
ncbi:MAG: LysM peptidoglycan-binding domain-containing protein [Pseudomonadota bacterium]